MEEMPAEEGYPAYLSSRLSEFYERAGRVKTLSGEEGSVTIIGAVSPPGGDFSEPVTRHTKEFVRCFWALDRNLAYSRHYPAINWLTSYSDFGEDLKEWFREHVGEDWDGMRERAMALLGEDDRLQQVIKLVGEDVLPDEHKLIVETGRLIKIGFLQQNSFSNVDSFCTLEKQFKMMELILLFYERARELIASGMAISEIKRSDVYLKLLRMKEEIPNDQLERFDTLREEIEKFFDNLRARYKEGAKSAS
jgi:V/A-type H+-transporting ATPase subunit A